MKEEIGMSTNFEFLKRISDDDYRNICGELYAVCCNTEELVYSKPKLSISESRVAGETIARLYFKKRVGDYGKLGFHELLTNPQFKDAVLSLKGRCSGRAVLDSLHEIRREGNPRHHGETVANPLTRALVNLEKLHGVIAALLLDLGLISPDLPYDYTEPPMPGGAPEPATVLQARPAPSAPAPGPKPAPAQETGGWRPISKVGKNDPCPCGSGLKYKYCHGKETDPAGQETRNGSGGGG